MPRGKKRIRMYTLYQRLFNYETKSSIEQRRAFARSIQDTSKVIKQLWDTGKLMPISTYQEQQYALPLAKNFLDNLRALLKNHKNPLKSWRYVDAEIILDGRLFPDLTVESLLVSFQYLYNPEDRDIIIMTFGKPKEMEKELGALATLAGMGTLKPALPPFLATVSYWDLANGKSYTTPVTSFNLIPQRDLLKACAAALMYD